MPEKIYLTYTNATAVPYQGSVLGHHIVLNYIDSNGDHHTLQGVPERRFDHNRDKLWAFSREEALSDGENNRDSPFQRLKAEYKDRDVSPGGPSTMVAEGDDLSSRWALMRDFADEVNSIGYEYRPISQNSNSFAGAALQRAGLSGPGTEFPERFGSQLVFDPVSGETTSFNVPGFEKPLTNPINTATPMPFPLDAPAAPLGPTNGFLAPDRPGSLDNQFGNRGSAPTDDTGSFNSPVLRALQNYRRSAAPDGPAQTLAQGALPATPASQPHADGTGGVLGKFIWDNPIPPAEAAPSLAQGARLLTPYFPGQESAFGDRSKDGPGVPGPDTYPQLHRVSPAFSGVTPPDLDSAPPQPGRPLGIFTGQPMPSWTAPPPLGGLLNNSNASGNIDVVKFLTGLLPRDPAQPEPPQQTADNKSGPRLGRSTYSISPASGYDPGAAAPPLAPSDDANYSGGLLGMFGMFAGKPGTDPQNSNQPAPLGDEQEQADLQALEDRFTNSGSINDAWALYKARMASRR